MSGSKSNIELRRKFERLRKLGKTYNEILNILKVDLSKSTMSYWARNIKLPNFYKDKIKKLNSESVSKAQLAALKTNRLKHKKLIDNFLKINKKITSNLSKNFKKIILAILYLGEGTKYKSHSGLILGSSDPNIIKIFINTLKECYKITTNDLKIRISYRADQDIDLLEIFWSKITGVSLDNFYKTKPDPRTIGKKTMKSDYKGVCVLTCAGAKIQLELEEIAKLLYKKISGR